ncbi:MAG: D-alanyl-D-alanine carboxypeptidase, partial [Candidatus Eremiobacteraeota bacterium]|nr:D-alanyl-D-alanine carboxypeptidase [Candidatus Eremiobacteraeota bacterium]
MKKPMTLLGCKIALATAALLVTTGVAPKLNSYDSTLITPFGRPQEGGAPWSPSHVAKLERDLNAILENKALRSAHIGLVIISTQNAQGLYARNADQEFMPASNFKLLTGSAALQKLGSDFTYTTTVSSDGTNLYLRGDGDSLLSAADLDEAAAQVAASGITHIAGSLITDASAFDAKRYA